MAYNKGVKNNTPPPNKERKCTMKLRDIIFLIDTDDFWITLDGNIEGTEHIEGTAEYSFRAMQKYFDCTVARMVPVANAIEIELKSPAA
jgi:hypothetical protein